MFRSGSTGEICHRRKQSLPAHDGREVREVNNSPVLCRDAVALGKDRCPSPAHPAIGVDKCKSLFGKYLLFRQVELWY